MRRMDVSLLGPEHVEKLLMGNSLNGGLESWKDTIIKDPCTYCGKQATDKPSKKERREGINLPDMMTVDHILTISHERGWCNQTACCSRCNLLKDNELLLFYLLRKLETNSCINQ
jgi:hypothetical protein